MSDESNRRKDILEDETAAGLLCILGAQAESFKSRDMEYAQVWEAERQALQERIDSLSSVVEQVQLQCSEQGEEIDELWKRVSALTAENKAMKIRSEETND